MPRMSGRAPHLSHFDTHGLTRDDIEIGMATILNHLGAHPMSIPANGLTIVHATGLHSVTPYAPHRRSGSQSTSPATLRPSTPRRSPILACRHRMRSTSRMSRLLWQSRASMPLETISHLTTSILTCVSSRYLETTSHLTPILTTSRRATCTTFRRVHCHGIDIPTCPRHRLWCFPHQQPHPLRDLFRG